MKNEDNGFGPGCPPSPSIKSNRVHGCRYRRDHTGSHRLGSEGPASERHGARYYRQQAFELGAAANFKVTGDWNNDLMTSVKAPSAS